MTDIEKRNIVDMEIRGLTIRNFRWMVGGLFTLTVMGVAFYISVMSAILKSNLQNADTSKREDVIEQKEAGNEIDIRNLYQNVVPNHDRRISVIEEQLKDDVKHKSN